MSLFIKISKCVSTQGELVLSSGGRRSGFTLLEVMVACAIFFMAAFAILGVVTQGLGAARAMQVKEPDIGMAIVTSGICLSNALQSGSYSGDFEDLFPDMYRGFSWQVDVKLVGSNGLFRADVVLFKEAGKKGVAETHTSILLHANQIDPTETPEMSVFNAPREEF
jgi:hypothetical protein